MILVQNNGDLGPTAVFRELGSSLLPGGPVSVGGARWPPARRCRILEWAPLSWLRVQAGSPAAVLVAVTRWRQKHLESRSHILHHSFGSAFPKIVGFFISERKTIFKMILHILHTSTNAFLSVLKKKTHRTPLGNCVLGFFLHLCKLWHWFFSPGFLSLPVNPLRWLVHSVALCQAARAALAGP